MWILTDSQSQQGKSPNFVKLFYPFTQMQCAYFKIEKKMYFAASKLTVIERGVLTYLW